MPHPSPYSAELLEMARIDQEMRQRSRLDKAEWRNEVDSCNTSRLKEIVEAIGWPTPSKVGFESARAAWLLVQHATHDLDFMGECYELMINEPEGQVLLYELALLYDRIALLRDGEQYYGTQFCYSETRGWHPFPIVPPEDEVDARRQAMGLRSLAEDLAHIKELNKNPSSA